MLPKARLCQRKLCPPRHDVLFQLMLLIQIIAYRKSNGTIITIQIFMTWPDKLQIA